MHLNFHQNQRCPQASGIGEYIIAGATGIHGNPLVQYFDLQSLGD
jgi:hypothetical protein